jgi:hypothetical protein
MVPQRFVVEYPERCLALLEMLEPMARTCRLVGSFSLLVAASAFVIPYERMQSRHPMHRRDHDGDLDSALRRLDNNEQFLGASFWNGASPGDWRFSRVIEHVENTHRWRDETGLHPMSPDAVNRIADCKAGKVLRVIRNALAHGNVVYLNAAGFEVSGTEVQFLAFLTRYEETEEQRRAAETYRLVVTREETFLRFVKAWMTWVASFPRDLSISDVA